MARLLMLLIKGYRLFLSPSLGSSCRFEPTCSVYALQAIQSFGAVKGGYLTLHRIGRCHPWCDGGHDPVPEKPAQVSSPLFTRLIPSSTQKKSS